MVNQKLHFGLAAIVLSSIMVFAVALPAANALTPRDFVYLQDNHKTDRFPGGQHVCGDHLCSADEWGKMKQSLRAAQRTPGECDQLKQWKACEPPTTKSGQ
jgi:hypothetical protein